MRPHTELQTEYQNYKNTLQQLAQKIGDIEQETEEHKYASPRLPSSIFLIPAPHRLQYSHTHKA
jgi:hypothetical protein